MWVPYIDKYEINEYGELRNSKTGRTLKPKISRKGYVFYTVSINGKQKDISAHRAVAEVFVPNPDKKPFVNHIDGNKRNNYYKNLEWSTAKENLRHALENNLFVHPFPPRRVAQYDLDGNLICIYDSVTEAAKAVCSNSGNIVGCCKGRYKTHKGFVWKYVEENIA